MDMLGLPGGKLRPPLRPLAGEPLAGLRRGLVELGLLEGAPARAASTAAAPGRRHPMPVPAHAAPIQGELRRVHRHRPERQPLGRRLRRQGAGRPLRHAAVHHLGIAVPLHLSAVPRRLPRPLSRRRDPVRQQVEQRPRHPPHHEPGGRRRRLLRRQRDVPRAARRHQSEDAGAERLEQADRRARDGDPERPLHQHRRHGRARPHRRRLQAPRQGRRYRHPPEARPRAAGQATGASPCTAPARSRSRATAPSGA